MEQEPNAGQQHDVQEHKRVTVSRRSYLAVFLVAVLLLFGLFCKIDEVLHPDRAEKAEVAYQEMVQSFREEFGMPEDSLYENPEVDTLKLKEEMQAGGKRPE